jgi:pilus assembly protein Flp/PilA
LQAETVTLFLRNRLEEVKYRISEDGPQAQTFVQKGITTMLFAPKEKGQGLVEYAIILALVAIVVIAIMRLLGPKIGNTFSTISSSLP